MKRSIRARFTLMLVTVMTALIFLTLCMNTWGLEGFYRKQKIRDIESAYERVNAEIMEGSGESGRLADILKEYADKYNIAIAVMDSADSSPIQSTEQGGGHLFRRVQKYLFNREFREQAAVLDQKENYTIISAPDEESGSSYIDCFGYCEDNRTVLLMTTPVANLKESVMLANRFLAYVGMLTLFFGVVLVFFMTRQITRPIQRLAALSQKMGGLDFTERYIGSNQDEIGILGNNMNAMADKLEETISELKRANAELQEDIRRKIEIDEMRKEFIANVSHELKTPIALIQGYAEGLEDGLCEDAESRSYYLDVIIDEAGKMNALVKQLLTLSQLESGAPNLEAGRFDLTELLRGVLHSVRVIAEERNISLELENFAGPADAPVFVCADEFKMEEVVTNYVSNALHHAEENGLVRASILRGGGQRVRVEIFNEGKPIPEEDLPHIWEKFYKVDKAHSRAYGGSGIGLSIVRAIMEAHGMPFGAENRESGVAFWFELPSDGAA